MRVTLEPHPDSFAPPVRIAVEGERTGPAGLTLRYVVTGEVGSVLFPPPAVPGPADRLWRHTCFEAFFRVRGDAGYFELNFAPSGQWAAYRFNGYRAGMARLERFPPPEMEGRLDGDGYRLAVSVELSGALAEAASVELGLSVVIETHDGGKSYWAAAHPPGEPDFHHRDCFALELPPPESR